MDAIRKRFKDYFHVVMVFILTFGVGLLQPFGQITEYGMDVLGIFLGTLYGWIFCELFWPSLLALLALGFTEFGDITTVLSAGFGNSNVIMIFMVFIFVGYLEKAGFMRFVAEWFVSRKICEGRPYVFLIMLMIPAAIFAAFINIYAGLVIIWALLFESFGILGFKKDDSYVCMAIMATTFAASVTPTLFTFRPIPIMAEGWAMNAVGYGYNHTTWFIIQGLAAIISVVIFLLVFRFVIKPDVSDFAKVKDIYEDLRNKKMQKKEKIALLVLVFFVVALTIPLIFPETIPVVAFINKFGIVGMASVCLVMVVLLKVNGKAACNIQECASTVNYPLIFMLVASFPLGDALGQTSTGIISTFNQYVTPLISNMTPLMFMISTIIVFNLISQVIHNLVLLIVFTPILCQLAVSVGLSIDVFLPIFVFTVNSALITPGASATGALLHGNVKWMSTKKTYLWAIVVTIIIYLTLIILVPIGMAIG